MNQSEGPRLGFTSAEFKVFQLCAVLVAVIAAGMYSVAPKGLGQVLGVLFSVLLLPVPPLVIYVFRRRKIGS
jgi:hypothetical protein